MFEVLMISALIGYIGKQLYNKAAPPKTPAQSLTKEPITTPEKPQTMAEEQKMNRRVFVSASSLSIATVSSLAVPSLGILSVPGIIYAGTQVFQNAYRKLVDEGKLSVEIPLAITLVSCVVKEYYWLGNMGAFLYTINRKILATVKQESQQSLVDMFQQVPRSAWVVIDTGVEIEMPIQKVQAGDRIRVYAGSAIPVDGVIIEGHASIDQHILTGEAQPAEKGPDEAVFASTVVLSGQIDIRVEKAGEHTMVAQITQILNNTVTYRSETQLKAENIADKTVAPTLLLAGAAWPLVGPGSAIAVVNAHFGTKMSIIASIGILRFIKMMSRHGILIKDGRVLDLLNDVDTIAFDKTGTLTLEQPQVGQIHSCSKYSENEILIYAAAAEYRQTHPIAKAILAELKVRSLVVSVIAETAYEIGYGIKVNFSGQSLRVGSKRFMEKESIMIPPGIAKREAISHREGDSLVMVALDERLIGAIELVATLRPEAKAMIQALKQRSKIKSIYLISGDHRLPTRNLAKQLGIENYFAEILPPEKAKIIEGLKASGRVVCYIGDGINDAIALKTAHVSISLQGASNIATDSASMVLMGGNLWHICQAFEIADKFNQTVQNNYTLVMVPSLIGMSGALFLGFSLLQTMLLNQISIIANLLYTMRPLDEFEHELIQSEKLLGLQTLSSKETEPSTVDMVIEAKVPSLSHIA